MKIAFTGTASTGKTTLINELYKIEKFKNLNIEFITADARSILESMGYMQIDEMSASQVKLFQRQYLQKKIYLEENKNDFITDRSYIDIAAYWLVRDCNDDFEKAKEVLEISKKKVQEYDIHFYFPYGVIPFEDDGYRSRNEEFRKKIGDQIENFCIDWNINFITINTPDIKERIKIVLDYIKKIK